MTQFGFEMLLVELMAAHWATRRHFGKRRCAEKIVRPMLDRLGAVTPADLDSKEEQNFAEMLMGRTAARRCVVAVCSKCRNCDFGRTLAVKQ